MIFITTAKNLSLPKFRINQLIEAKYKKGLETLSLFTSWPKDLREKHSAELDPIIFTLEAKRQVASADGQTIKVLFARKSDSAKFETVLMKHADGRNTVCVSCMIGCPVNCAFCATGKLGYKANLTADEIVDQVLYFVAQLAKTQEKVTNVVFMGMGEPLLNLAQVKQALELLTSPEYMGLGDRRITISTSGYVPQLKDLLNSGFKGNLALSLHSAIQEKRASLMPVAKVYPINELMTAIDQYTSLQKRRVTYEYILIKDLNDGEEDALALVNLLKDRLAHINLIPYNKILGADFEQSTRNRIFNFRNILLDHGLNATIRVTMGDDENAACGQLALNN